MGLVLFLWFDNHRRAIAQDFGHSLHDFGGIVAYAYDGVGSHLGSVLDHEIVSIVTGFFA